MRKTMQIIMFWNEFGQKHVKTGSVTESVTQEPVTQPMARDLSALD